MATFGQLKDTNLLRLLQDNSLGQQMVRITVQSAAQVGDIYLASGNVVQATLGNLRGEQALHRMLAWNHGTFRIESAQQPFQPAVPIPWQNLQSPNDGQTTAAGSPDGQQPPAGPAETPLPPEATARLKLLKKHFLQALAALEQNLLNISKSAPARQPLRTLVFMTNAINLMLDLMAEHPEGRRLSAELIGNLVDRSNVLNEIDAVLQLRQYRFEVRFAPETRQAWTQRLARRPDLSPLIEHLYWILLAISTATLELFETSAADGQYRQACDWFLARVSANIPQIK